MSEETTPKQAAEAPGAASNTGGTDNGARRPSMRQDKDGGMGMGMDRGGDRPLKGRRRRKVSYLTINKIYNVDYKEINILRKFINEHGKIQPSRQTGCTAKQQRMISRAIRRAREMALLPFVVTEVQPDRPMRPRAPRDGYVPREHREPREPREPRGDQGTSDSGE